MWNRISYTWDVMGHCWGLLKADKKLIVFPILSAIACLLVLASFAAPLWMSDQIRSENLKTPLNYALLFAYYFCNYFVIVFFNSALITCASLRMAGHTDVPLARGFEMAGKRIHLIAGWALLSATVGVILQIIENAHSKAGEILSSLLGMAWTMLTFLAVPALVIDGVGPIEAVKTSARLFKKTWGEQVVGNFSFGWIFALLSIPVVILLIVGVAMLPQSQVLGVMLVALSVLALILLAIVNSALQTIFQTTLYLYTRDQKAPAGLDPRLLQGAVA
jgi:hypothetical protein